MTIAYAVFQQGVYRHDCIGIFLSSDEAQAAAIQAARADHDSYHDYEVVPFEVGFVYLQGDPDRVFSVDKNKASEL